MKKIIVVTLLLCSVSSYASQKAITDTGEEIILNSNGTWEYSNQKHNQTNTIETNKNKFKKPKKSSFLLKSTKNDAGFWINTSKWTFNKSKNNLETEYEFHLKGTDLYAMAITEGIEVNLQSLFKLALDNARAAAPDTKVVKKEYRNVNGKKVLYAEMHGTVEGIKFAYLSYYHSNPSGSTQLVTYTGKSVVSKYQPEINEFLNGFTLQ